MTGQKEGALHEIYSGNEKETSGTVPYGKGQNRRNRKID